MTTSIKAKFLSIATVLGLTLLCSASAIASEVAVRVMSELEMTKAFPGMQLSAVLTNRAKLIEKKVASEKFFPESETKLVGLEVKYSDLVVSLNSNSQYPGAYLEMVKAPNDSVQNAALTVKMILAPAVNVMFSSADTKIKEQSHANIRGLVLAINIELTAKDGKKIISKIETPYFQNGKVNLLNQVSAAAGQFVASLSLAKFDSTGLKNESTVQEYFSYQLPLNANLLSSMASIDVKSSRSFEANVRAMKLAGTGWAVSSLKVNASLRMSTEGCNVTGKIDVVCLDSYSGLDLLSFADSSMRYTVGSRAVTNQGNQQQNGGVDVTVTPIGKDGVGIGIKW